MTAMFLDQPEPGLSKKQHINEKWTLPGPLLTQLLMGNRKPGRRETAGLFFYVRQAGRTYLGVKVPYTPGKGKC